MYGILLALLATSVASAPMSNSNPRIFQYGRRCMSRQDRGCGGTGGSTLLSYMQAGRGGTPSVPSDVCSTFAADLTAPSFCLRGDGTSTGSLSLSAVGSPTTQPWPWCENGLSCGSVSRQLVSASNYFQTASMSQPSGSWWACVRGIVDAPLPSVSRYVAQSTAWELRLNSSGQVVVAISGGTNISGGSAVGGASEIACVWYHHAGTGAVNTLTAYLDGAQVAQNTTEPELAATTAQITIGQAFSTPISRLGFAMFGTGDPSSTLFARLAAATAPTPQGTRGEALTFARASAASCTAPDGSVTWLQPGRPCISGGIRVRPAVTNLLLQTEDLTNAAWTTANASVVANQTTAPDGAVTADFIKEDATNNLHQISQNVTIADNSAATLGASLKAGTRSWARLRINNKAGTGCRAWFNIGTGSIGTVDASCAATIRAAGNGFYRATVSTTSVSTGAQQVAGQVFVQTADNQTTYAGDGASGIYATDLQLEAGAVASDPCPSQGTSATCAAETASVPMPSGASATAGCAKACLNPMWSGAEPLGQGHFYLSANATTARLLQTTANGQNVAINDGTNLALQATTFTAGTKRCFVARWDNTGASTTDQTSGSTTTNASVRVSGFGNTLQIGQNGLGAGYALATISDIQFGASAGACN